jgi:hypothetical protein
VDWSVFDGAVRAGPIQTTDIHDAVGKFVVLLDDDNEIPSCGKQNVNAQIRVGSQLPQPDPIFYRILVLEEDPT